MFLFKWRFRCRRRFAENLKEMHGIKTDKHVKGVQNFCFCQLSMQILWRPRCSQVVDLKLPNSYLHARPPVNNLVIQDIVVFSQFACPLDKPWDFTEECCYFSYCFIQGYQSTSFTVPPRDPTPDYNLIKATEENGFTNVQFDRIPTTEGDEKDVQFGVRNSHYFIHMPLILSI